MDGMADHEPLAPFLEVYQTVWGLRTALTPASPVTAVAAVLLSAGRGQWIITPARIRGLIHSHQRVRRQNMQLLTPHSQTVGKSGWCWGHSGRAAIAVGGSYWQRAQEN